MVAYTSDSCIPYFQGPEDICLNTGSVCDPSTVWCDMAAIIDAKLTEFDSLISTSIASFPYAEVAITTLPVVIDSGTSSGVTEIATWDAVLGDSDNIVDLGTDPNTLFLRRSGIWNVRCAVVWRSTLAQTQMYINLVHPAAPIVPITTLTISDRIWVEAVPDPGAPTITGTIRGLETTLDMMMPVNVATGPAPINIIWNGFANAAFDLTIYQAFLSVRWVAELP